jgi:hypothetical protein
MVEAPTWVPVLRLKQMARGGNAGDYRGLGCRSLNLLHRRPEKMPTLLPLILERRPLRAIGRFPIFFAGSLLSVFKFLSSLHFLVGRYSTPRLHRHFCVRFARIRLTG